MRGKNQQRQMKLQVTQVLDFIQMLQHTYITKKARGEKTDQT